MKDDVAPAQTASASTAPRAPTGDAAPAAEQPTEEPPEKQARVEETEDEAVKTKLMWQKAHGDNRIALFAWTGSKDKSQILEFTYNGKEMHRDELLQKYRSLVSPYFKKRKGLVKHWPKHELNDLREMLRQARDAS